jgi:DNA polymerase elongation subunit (family B)
VTSVQLTPTEFQSHYKKCILDIETTDFFPWSGRIICIGIKDTDTGAIQIFQDAHEETLIMQFLKYFNKQDYSEIIGFNLPYDLRYIFAKCLQYKLPSHDFFSKQQKDLMMILKNVKGGYNFNKPGTLGDWSKTLLGKKKLFDNLQVPGLYREGRINDIIKYNRNDLELTYELWKRIVFVLEK